MCEDVPRARISFAEDINIALNFFTNGWRCGVHTLFHTIVNININWRGHFPPGRCCCCCCWTQPFCNRMRLHWVHFVSMSFVPNSLIYCLRTTSTSEPSTNDLRLVSFRSDVHLIYIRRWLVAMIISIIITVISCSQRSNSNQMSR